MKKLYLILSLIISSLLSQAQIPTLQVSSHLLTFSGFQSNPNSITISGYNLLGNVTLTSVCLGNIYVVNNVSFGPDPVVLKIDSGVLKPTVLSLEILVLTRLEKDSLTPAHCITLITTPGTSQLVTFSGFNYCCGAVISDLNHISLKAFPNPISFGEIKFNKEISFEVSDISGMIIYTTKLIKNSYNVNELSSGVYFLRSNNNEVLKVLVE